MSNTDKKWKEAYEKRMKVDNALLQAIKAKLPELEKLLQEVMDHWVYEDLIYRFYHQSFKVYYIQEYTLQMVAMLKSLQPDRPLNKWFTQIIEEGTGKTFSLEDNDRWLSVTRPLIEAFLHAKYHLEMCVKYGKEMEEATGSLPSGWASVLYLYDMR